MEERKGKEMQGIVWHAMEIQGMAWNGKARNDKEMVRKFNGMHGKVRHGMA
jgi:hypothetical protein